ncbi:MAG: hypothetical protein UY89_C0003G0014 [Parcubacteria group bacterium GW2011_GWA1_54_9]|nr:MAG: hypothetical protein UY89_C0003G0014 [Parcubacteria group bacterium GW2011_GWA1_54_9]
MSEVHHLSASVWSTPEKVAGTEGSHTGKYLDKILKRHKKK